MGKPPRRGMGNQHTLHPPPHKQPTQHTMTTKSEKIIRAWRDYEGNVVKCKQDFDAAVKKTQEVKNE